MGTLGENLWPSFRKFHADTPAPDALSMFGIIFPSCTGIMRCDRHTLLHACMILNLFIRDARPEAAPAVHP